MSSGYPMMTRNDRAYRREKAVKAYVSGLSSRAVAERFGLDDRYVREIVCEQGVSRAPGRPRTRAAKPGGSA